MKLAIAVTILTLFVGCDSQLQRARSCLSLDGRPVFAAEPPYQLTACVFEGAAR